MTELWRFENCRLVTLTDTNGESFSGYVLDCDDADEEEGWEETITIEARTGEIRMYAASEVASVEVIKR